MESPEVEGAANKRVSDDAFAGYLREAEGESRVVEGDKSVEVTPLSSLSEAISAMYVNGLEANLSFADRSEFVLEKFASAVERGDLRSIGDLIQELSDILANVDAENISGEGKKLLEEMRIVAYTEGIKWVRGDYI